MKRELRDVQKDWLQLGGLIIDMIVSFPVFPGTLSKGVALRAV